MISIKVYLYIIYIMVTIFQLLAIDHILWSPFIWQSYPLHSVMESFGVLAAILLAIILLRKYDDMASNRMFWVANGLLVMGVLDFFHSVLLPGRGFVISHNLSVLLGGFSFALVWIPEPEKNSRIRIWLPRMVFSGLFMFGLSIIIFRGHLPLMVDNGQLTTSAIYINLIGGSLFLLASGRLLIDFLVYEKRMFFIFSVLSLLFGLAGITYLYASRWSDIWWFCHILRLMGYLLVAAHLLGLYIYRESRLDRALSVEKKLQVELRQSEKDYRYLVHNANSIILRMNPDGVITFFNEFAQRFFGYPDDYVIGKNVVGTIVPVNDSAGENLQAMVRDIGRHPELYPYNENENMRVNGDRVWVAWTNKGIRDENNKVVELLCVGNDITERKKVEDALRESEQKFRRLSDAAEEGVAIHRKGVIVDANEAFARLFDRELDEIVGNSAENLLTAETWQTVLEKTRNEYDQPYEGFGIRRDGSQFPIRLVGKPYIWQGIKYRVAVIRDISLRKSALMELEKTERNYQEIFHSITEALLIHDAKSGDILDVNKSGCEMFGYTRDELKKLTIGKLSANRLSFTHQEGMARLKQANDKGSLTFEWLAVNGSGRELWLEVNLRKAIIGGKECILSLDRDITDQKKTKDDLNLLKKAIATTQTGITITDINGKILYLNHAEAAMHGYRTDELVGQDIGIFAPPHMRNQLSVEAIISVKPSRRESINKRKNGSVFPVQLDSSLVYNQQGELLGVVTTCQDITERKRSEGEIKRYQHQLRALASELSLAEERERRQIANEIHDGIIQDLAYSLRTLQEALKWTRSARVKNSLIESLILLEQSIHRSRSLIFELSPPVLYDLGLEAAIEWLVDEYRKKYGLAIEYVTDNEPKPLAEDVRNILFMIVRELLINIVKHSRARRSRVSSMLDRDKIKITVEDDGVGFIGGPFGYSVESGTGYGLFSIRERLRFLGGEISIESKNDRGVHVTIIVPLTGTKKE